MIMIDADDVSRHAESLRADIIAKIIGRLGLEKTMFEASNPQTSEWFINHYGPKVRKDSLSMAAFPILYSMTDNTAFFYVLYLGESFCGSLSSYGSGVPSGPQPG